MGFHRQCDGVTRRDAIKVGVLGSATGLTMGNFLRMADAGQINPKADSKAAIFIELPGGPSHMDTFDLKPNAPSEFRGKFNPIKTNASGVEICEHLPKLAQCADKFAILRGVSHSLGAHPLGQQFVFTGNRPNPSLDYPGYGSVVAKEIKSDDDLPAYVSIPKVKQGPGHLGVKYASLQTNATPKFGLPFSVRGITLGNGVTMDEMQRRSSLLKDLDRTFDTIKDRDDLLSGLDKFSQKAFSMITSNRARDAFDLSKEAPNYTKLFGEDDFSQSCMLASRLVESGVKFVTVSLGGWDTHSDNFTKLQNNLLPKLDAGLSGLFNGLAAKGLLDSTTVFVSGEFGRTPKINSRTADGGRDHYPRCMFMLMGGGPINGGQVIGESDATAAGPKHEGINPEDAAASFFRTLGINHRKEYDTSIGRPISIVRDGNVIPGLIG
jgi:hypothetical protein|tara:strand:- start:56 stop:1366 length:1311 start_codon:yes stop_codon:yes gene_type:complete